MSYPAEAGTTQPKEVRIRANAQKLYHDLLKPVGQRTSREGILMTPTTEQLMLELEKGLPILEQRKIINSIAAAEETLGDLTRRDGVTPHLHHVLRAGLRIRDRLEKELGPEWYTVKGALDRVEGGIGHDSKEDGRRKRFIRDSITGQERRMTTQDVQDILLRHTGYTPESPVYIIMDKFDKYDNNEPSVKRKHEEYLQILKEAGLGPDKMDDTVDNMCSDSSRAGRALGAKVLDMAEIAKTLKELQASRKTTEFRFNFFRDQLTEDHAEELETQMTTAALFIATLETQLTPGDARVPHPRRGTTSDAVTLVS